MTLRSKIAVVVAGVAVIAGMTACGNASDEAEGPTVADVQEQALAAQERARAAEQDPAKRYPPLPQSPPQNWFQDDKLNGESHFGDGYTLTPVDPTNQVQRGQDPVLTALQRIQEISAKSADISNRAQEALDYFASVDGLYNAVKDDLDGKTRDGLQKGFSDMRDALNRSLTAPGVEVDDLKAKVAAMEDAETASGDIQVVVYRFAQDRFEPGADNVIEERGTFCSPTTGCGLQGYGDYK